MIATDNEKVKREQPVGKKAVGKSEERKWPSFHLDKLNYSPLEGVDFRNLLL
jgi:hypothetical protein